MAYQPPYGYGGSYGSGGQYGYGGSQTNREAMLRALAQPDNPNYQYPTGNLRNVRTQTGPGSQIAETAFSAGERGAGVPTAPGTIATELIGGALKPKGQAATASPYADLTDQYTRRMEGSGEGIAGGAVKWGGRGAQLGLEVGGPVGAAIGGGIGAIGGAIGGAFTKNAKSAYSDFRTQDAVEAIRNMYKTRGGRLPTEQEVETILIGQGMDPQSARTHTGVVGEKGLYSVLHSLDQNFAKERQHLVDQATGGGGTGSAAGGTGSEPVAQLLGAGATPASVPPYPTGGGSSRGGTFPTGQSPSAGPRAGLPALPTSYQGGDQSYQLPDGTVINGMTGRPMGSIAGAASGQQPGTAPTQASAGPAESAAAPAPPAAPPAPTLPANADTDGYAAPAYTAAAASSSPPPGWDAKKWGDQSHQTPKYVVGRIMSQFAPTTENMPKVLAEIQKAYPGTTMIGKDTINIPGVGKTDVLRGADVGGKGWQWLGEHAQSGGGKAAGGGGTSGAGYDASGDVSGQSTIAQIIAQLSGMAGGQPGGGGVMSARDALLNQFKAG